MKRFSLLALLSLSAAISNHALAEKADADKPTNVEANQMAYDDVKQINVFTGNVVLTRGTLILRAEKLVVTQDPEGYQYATAYAVPGGFTTFRQKRDGGPDLWIEGQAADRIEYDSRTQVAKFFSRARIRLLDGQRVTDEVQGEFISYDSKTEFYSVNNTASGKSKPGEGRIKMTIQPRENKGK